MIKQSVNLYSSSLLPPKLKLSFKRLVAGAVVVSIIAVVCGTLLMWQTSRVENKLEIAKTEQDIFNQKKQQLEAQIAVRKPDNKLVEQVNLEQQRLTLKQKLKGELAARRTAVSMGYSPLLVDLAKVSDASVWLSRIQINKGKYEFEGYGATAQSIPLWVEKLKATDTLKGYTFAAMTMSRGEDRPLAFKLTSQPVKEDVQ
ncbi:PilN domain-containing protein [Shewanella intestini]|uniref:PilN domain-containing protein n=1 Tax=Shewanella intestini TaxID=2017544 RepID=A0ABS5I4Y1_9GAMM|nr:MULTISPECIES: PilN domain-containing protein [Shewanella]MBR9729071.1 PilN domain-containing protein [Shewanella intestini]MRG37147.1 fimbrial assembly protein [Shewanella sp. XMDDZSB0408]